MMCTEVVLGWKPDTKASQESPSFVLGPRRVSIWVLGYYVAGTLCRGPNVATSRCDTASVSQADKMSRGSHVGIYVSTSLFIVDR